MIGLKPRVWASLVDVPKNDLLDYQLTTAMKLERCEGFFVARVTQV